MILLLLLLLVCCNALFKICKIVWFGMEWNGHVIIETSSHFVAAGGAISYPRGDPQMALLHIRQCVA